MFLRHPYLFPKILLTGADGRQGTEPAGLTLGAGNFFSLGPQITLPIFTGGKIRGNIEGQKQRLDQASTAYQSTILRSLEAETRWSRTDTRKIGRRGSSRQWKSAARRPCSRTNCTPADSRTF